MMANVFVILDVCAFLLILPTLLKHLLSYLAGTSALHQTFSKVFRTWDQRLGYLYTPLTYVVLDYILVRLFLLLWFSSAWLGIKLAVGAAILLFMGLAIFPIGIPIHLLLMLLCKNPPYLANKSELFPNSKKFENPESWKKIQEELLSYLAHSQPHLKITDYYPNITIAPKASDDQPEKGWRMLVLRGLWRDVPHNMARLPYLSSLIREMPEIHTAFLSILDPGMSIPEHRGYYKGLYRYHLGMVVPEPSNTYLVCDGEPYHWKEGEGVLFDDVFVHSAHNTGERARVVLFVDVVRPLPFLLSALNQITLWLMWANPWLAKKHMQ